MVLPRHATVYHDTKQLGMVHLLNLSTTIWRLSAELARALRFYRVVIGRDLVLDVLSDIRLLPAQVDTLQATSFN